MKKLFAFVFIVIMAIMSLYGCGGDDSNTPSDTNTPLNIEATEIKIAFKDYFLRNTDEKVVWQYSDAYYLDVNFYPTNATNKEVEWTTSDSHVANVYKTWADTDKGAYYLSVGSPGKATLTATTSNGVSAAFEIEVKQRLFYDVELPLVVSMGSGSNLRRYTITSISYSREYEKYSAWGVFTVMGSKTYDAKGDNHATSDTIISINIYNSNNFKTETKSMRLISMLNGDKFVEKIYVTSLNDSGAPYTMKLIVNT